MQCEWRLSGFQLIEFEEKGQRHRCCNNKYKIQLLLCSEEAHFLDGRAFWIRFVIRNAALM